jgi:hypothetical protein
MDGSSGGNRQWAKRSDPNLKVLHKKDRVSSLRVVTSGLLARKVMTGFKPIFLYGLQRNVNKISTEEDDQRITAILTRMMDSDDDDRAPVFGDSPGFPRL